MKTKGDLQTCESEARGVGRMMGALRKDAVLMTGLCAVRVGMLESKRTVHLDLARSNADVFLLASGRSGCRVPIERVDVDHAKAAKDRAPAHLRGAIGCHRSVHAVGARKLSCRRFSFKLRLHRCDCSRSSFTQVMPHTQLPYRRALGR
jgi:hypothetical protein